MGIVVGGLFMDSKEMLKTKLPPGHIFMNVAKLGSKPKWRIVPKPATWGKEVAPGRHGLVHVDT